MDWKGNGLRNVRSGGAVKESKLNRRNRFGRKIVILNVLGVNKTVARTGVNQGKETKNSNNWRVVGFRTGANFSRVLYSE